MSRHIFNEITIRLLQVLPRRSKSSYSSRALLRYTHILASISTFDRYKRSVFNDYGIILCYYDSITTEAPSQYGIMGLYNVDPASSLSGENKWWSPIRAIILIVPLNIIFCSESFTNSKYNPGVDSLYFFSRQPGPSSTYNFLGFCVIMPVFLIQPLDQPITARRIIIGLDRRKKGDTYIDSTECMLCCVAHLIMLLWWYFGRTMNRYVPWFVPI